MKRKIKAKLKTKRRKKIKREKKTKKTKKTKRIKKVKKKKNLNIKREKVHRPPYLLTERRKRSVTRVNLTVAVVEVDQDPEEERIKGIKKKNINVTDPDLIVRKNNSQNKNYLKFKLIGKRVPKGLTLS